MKMKRFMLILFALIIAMMCWEQQRSEANVLDNGPIPQESIRLRILANSDSITDQWLKREVRDAIVDQMNTWVTDIGSYEEARLLVAERLPELQKLVDKTIKERGFAYPAVVDFGQVPFPTKLYGSYVYPAGNYEALRVQIGEAKGQNWWCVLFPPLCFIDMANGDAVVRDRNEQPSGQMENVSQADSKVEEAAEPKEETRDRESDRYLKHEIRWNTVAEKKQQSEPTVAVEVPAVQPEPQVEVRFFLWDRLSALF